MSKNYKRCKKWAAILMVFLMLLSNYTPTANAEENGSPAATPQLENHTNPDMEQSSEHIINSTLPNPVQMQTGTLHKNGVPIVNTVFSVHTVEEDPQWYDFMTSDTGVFFLHVPDGTYQLDGVWIEKEAKWYEVNKRFTVVDGRVEDSSSLWIIEVAEQQSTTANVTGTLKKGNDPLDNVWFSVHTTSGEEKWYDIQSDANGQFTATLPDGTYKLEGVWLNSDNHWYELKKEFTVQGSAQWEINVLEQLTGPNFTGTLKKGDTILPNVIFSIHTTEGTETWYDLQTNENGQFNSALPDGTYRLEGIWLPAENKWYDLQKEFTVSGNLDLLIDLLAPKDGNVTGTLKKGNQPIANTIFSIRSTTDDVWYDAKTDENGWFKFTLPDGTYTIAGVWVEAESKWYELNLPFTVQQTLNLDINLLAPIETQPNITGTLKKGAEPLSNLTFSIHSTSGDQWYDTTTDQQGNFQFTLPDGTYQLDGIWNPAENKWYELNQPFTITGGVLVGAELLEINLSPIQRQNVVGTISDSNDPIENAEVEIHLKNSTISHKVVTDDTGTFTIQLEDGEYEIIRITTDDTIVSYIYQTFSVKNGKMMVEEKETTLLPITIPNKTVDVKVKNAQDELFLGSYRLIMSSTDGKTFVNAAMEDGKASLRLSDGTYIAEYINTDTFKTLIEKEFTVENGQVYVNGEPKEQLDIKLQPVSLNGRVMDAGKGVSGATVVVYKGVTSNFDPLSSYRETSDENGYFHFGLPDGTYNLNSIYVNKQSILKNMIFEIKDGKLVLNGSNQDLLNIDIPPVTLMGSLTTQGGTNSQVTIDFIDKKTNRMTRMSTDEAGNFLYRLGDGDYVIRQLYLPDLKAWVIHHQEFSIVSGKLMVAGSEQESLPINLQKVTQVNGRVETSWEPSFENAWFNVKAEGSTIVPPGINLNKDGSFQFYLQEGKYQVTSITLEGKSTVQQIAFEVKDGKLFVNGTEQSELVLSLSTATIQGQISFGFEAGDKMVYIDVLDQYNRKYSAWSNQEGKLELTVPDGEYKVLHAYPNEMKKWIFVNPATFSVIGGKLFINGENKSLFTVEIPKVQLINGTLAENGVPVANATVRILKEDHPGALSMNVDANGNFTYYLQDGKYNVSSVTINNQVFQTFMSFEIINGRVLMDGMEQDKLNVNLPSINVRATIINEAGAAQKDTEVLLFGSPIGFQYFKTDGNGQLILRLPNGNYEVAFLIPPNGQLARYNLKFTIQDGSLFVGGEQKTNITLAIPKVYQIPVHVEKDGQPAANVDMFIGFQDSTISFGSYCPAGKGYSCTDDHGDGRFDLPDGKYRVVRLTQKGVSLMTKELLFEIINGKVYVDGVEQVKLIIKI